MYVVPRVAYLQRKYFHGPSLRCISLDGPTFETPSVSECRSVTLKEWGGWTLNIQHIVMFIAIAT